MRKVLFFSHYPTYAGLDGANKILLVTARGLSSERYQKRVISPGRGSLSEHLKDAGIEEHIFEYDCGHFNGMLYAAPNKGDFEGICQRIEEVLSQTDLFRFIKEWKPDIVYANTVMAVNGAVMGKMAGAKVIWHLHDIVTQSLGEQDQLNINRMIARYADKVIIVSKAVSGSFPLVSNLPNSELIYVGVDAPVLTEQEYTERRRDIRKRMGLQDSAPLAAFLGQIAPVKGVEHFIMAAHHILKFLPSARFVIIGDPSREPGYTQRLRNMIQRLRRTKQIRFGGYCRDLSRTLPAVDCLLVPSRFEDPLPAVMMEANRYHVPVVAYRRGGIQEAVVHGRNGYLVEPDNTRHMAAAAYKVLKEPDLRQRMGQFGCLRTAVKFGYARYLSNMEAIFTETANGLFHGYLRDGQVFRSGGRFWYIHRGQRHPLAGEDTLSRMGLHAGDAIDVDLSDLEAVPEGSTIYEAANIL